MRCSNAIVLERCIGMMPATIADMTAGVHTIGITDERPVEGERLGRQRQAGANRPTTTSSSTCRLASRASRRFFMLNGVGTMSRNLALRGTGAVQIMFIDSDTAINGGRGQR